MNCVHKKSFNFNFSDLATKVARCLDDVTFRPVPTFSAVAGHTCVMAAGRSQKLWLNESHFPQTLKTWNLAW